MIVLDTNVVSEPIRGLPAARVLDWLDAQVDTAITAITVGELLVGVSLLPEGRRREGLHAVIEDVIGDFARRVLPYDRPAAREYASIREACRLRGRGIGAEDGMIAGIVRSVDGTLATRNLRDFEGLGFPVINPWDDTDYSR